MATIRAKIIMNMAVMLITIAVIVTLEFRAIATLGRMQDEGAQRSDAAVLAKEASMGGLALYRVIADAEVNRDLERILKTWQAKKAEVLKNLEATAAIADTAEEKRFVAAVKDAVAAVIGTFEQKMVPLLREGDGTVQEVRALDRQIELQVQNIESEMDKVTDSLVREMRQADRDFDAERRKALFEGVMIGLAGVLLQTGLGIMLLKGIMTSVNAIRALLTAVSAGDLTRQAEIGTRDELAETAREFNGFVLNLQDMVRQIAATAHVVVASSERLSSGAEKIAAAAEEVAQQSATVATAGEEMSATSGDIAQSCQRASEGAIVASRSAQDGAQVVETTVSVMGQISARVQESSRTVERLGERSD
ncbi:methyl-accepting chemotaxis protein [Geomonas diazotrophica]